jgi:hypothetical protein
MHGYLNGDGTPDVVKGHDNSTFIPIYSNNSFPGQVALYDAGNISLTVLPNRFLEIRAADLNGDGRTDLVVLGDLEVFVLTNKGTGGSFSFSAVRIPINQSVGGSANATDIEIADLNKDGRPDLAIAVRQNFVANTIKVWNNTNTGGVIAFQETGSYTMPGMDKRGRLALGVLDGDSRTDMVHGSETTGFSVPRNMTVGGA